MLQNIHVFAVTSNCIRDTEHLLGQVQVVLKTKPGYYTDNIVIDQ